MFDKHRSTAGSESFDIELLFLRIERSQLRWFGHVSRMPHEWLPRQTLYVEVSAKRQVGRPRTKWLDYFEDRGWNLLGPYPSEMQSVLVYREVRRLKLELMHPYPTRKNGSRKKRSCFENNTSD